MPSDPSTLIQRAVAAACLCILLLGGCARLFAAPDSEVAFERWLAAEPERAAVFARFGAALAEAGVSDVVPNYQLWRVDRSRPECIRAPFAVPPEDIWRNIVPTLRFVRDHVQPRIGAVEVASGFRDTEFNACVHGAPQSAHKSFFALDLVPVDRRVNREGLIASLCAVHASEGPRARIGLGIYGGRRFHVDARRFRGWGADYRGASFPCLAHSR